MKNEFTLDDVKTHLISLIQPGIIRRLIGLMPGMGDLTKMMRQDNDRDVRRLVGVINAMTSFERRNPKLIDPSRCKRIAQGAGTQTQQVWQLVKQFEFVAPLMKAMAGKGLAGRIKAIQDLKRGFEPGT